MSKYDALWNYVNNHPEDSLNLTFDEIGEICGVPMDHSFLTYKKELAKYGWQVGKISLKNKTINFRKSV